MRRIGLTVVALSAALSACHSPSGPSTSAATYDIEARGVPQFVGQQFIPLTNISRISRFRSAEGHPYNAGGSIPGEPCRSLKHYFSFLGFAPATQTLFSPVDGTVRSVDDDGNGFGLGVTIVPAGQPAFWVILFHVALSIPLAAGNAVTAGERLGVVATGVESDIAIGVQTPQGYRLVSWFDVITDALFQEYRNRGVGSRSDLIISKAARDADPISCNGDAFTSAGTIPNWVDLH